MRVGYVRVSKHIQNKDLQLDALNDAGCERIFIDEESGSKIERKGLTELLSFVRFGDVVVVWRLDRLSRRLMDMLLLVSDLNTQGVSLVSCTQQIDTATPNGKLYMHLFGTLAEWERDQLIERTNAGLAAARARGRIGGRKKILNEKEESLVLRAYESKQYTIAEVCGMVKGKPISKDTLRRIVMRHRQQAQEEQAG